MGTLVLNLVAALSYAAGVNFMKASNGLRNLGPAALVYLCFAIGATIQAIALQRQQVGVSNAIVLGFETVGALLISVALFKEPVTVTKVVAIGLVSAGVYLLHQA